MSVLTRRLALVALMALPASSWAMTRGGRDLAFDVRRNGDRIGSHAIRFHGDEQDFTAAITAQFVVKLGPVPIFHYQHQALETWRGGRFQSLQSRTVSNGRVEQVSAARSDSGVVITVGAKRILAPVTAHPLTHWNAAALEGPLFNPQTGVALRESVSKAEGQSLPLAGGRMVPATRYVLAGDAEIVDWYVDGAWTALRGKAPDGSWLDYRRSA